MMLLMTIVVKTMMIIMERRDKNCSADHVGRDDHDDDVDVDDDDDVDENRKPSLPRKQSRREDRAKRATRTIPVTNNGFSN